MGYTLRIGEFETVVDHKYRHASVTVRLEDGESIGAPLNSTHDHSNRIMPSYSGWADFCERVGLADVFLRGDAVLWTGESGETHGPLLWHHPGAAELTADHLVRFRAALDAYAPVEQSGGGPDYDLRRLEWLVWWTEWSLENCEHPTFANS